MKKAIFFITISAIIIKCTNTDSIVNTNNKNNIKPSELSKTSSKDDNKKITWYPDLVTLKDANQNNLITWSDDRIPYDTGEKHKTFNYDQPIIGYVNWNPTYNSEVKVHGGYEWWANFRHWHLTINGNDKVWTGEYCDVKHEYGVCASSATIDYIIECNEIQKPNPPILLSPADGSIVGEYATLQWSVAFGAYISGYQLQVDDDINFGSPCYSCEISGTSQSVYIWYTYNSNWRVRSKNPSGYSEWSRPWKVKPAVPAVPSISGTMYGEHPIISWPKVSRNIGYKIYRNGILITTLGSNKESYEDLQAWRYTPPNTKVTTSYQVKSYNFGGESGFSSTISFTTNPILD